MYVTSIREIRMLRSCIPSFCCLQSFTHGHLSACCCTILQCYLASLRAWLEVTDSARTMQHSVQEPEDTLGVVKRQVGVEVCLVLHAKSRLTSCTALRERGGESSHNKTLPGCGVCPAVYPEGLDVTLGLACSLNSQGGWRRGSRSSNGRWISCRRASLTPTRHTCARSACCCQSPVCCALSQSQVCPSLDCCQ